ncbi:hypothetical protein BRD00_06585 [Halobacteriales archaeon QS_8_69_26]|nr:MAG: hypothetical protein BRD00_06585 [Halobacteriales archaeon QS_8_69_26]
MARSGDGGSSGNGDTNVDLTGAVDLHTHVGPSTIDRRVDAYECAVEVAEAGMAGVVFKEHFLPTAYGVPFVDRLLGRDGHDVAAMGSVVCNYPVGGFNPHAVATAIDYGARVVWGPTIDARHHARQTGQLAAFLGAEAGEEYADEEGITALDDDGNLRDEVRLCVEKVAAADALLCLGHLSFQETREVVAYAADRGADVVVDHPTYGVTDLNTDQQRELAALGAKLNFPFVAISDAHGWTTPADLADAIRAVGVDHCVVSSDVGQVENPSVPEALRRLGAALLAEGFSAAEFDRMVRIVPRELVGID